MLIGSEKNAKGYGLFVAYSDSLNTSKGDLSSSNIPHIVSCGWLVYSIAIDDSMVAISALSPTPFRLLAGYEEPSCGPRVHGH